MTTGSTTPDERRVRDAMTTPVLAVAPETPVEDVAHVLTEHKVGAVPVVDAGRHVVGVIAESDVVLRAATATAAAQLMTVPPIVVEADAPLHKARRALAAHGIGRLPVVDRRRRLIGIISRRDLLAALLPADTAIRREVVGAVAAADVELVALTVSHGKVWLCGRVSDLAATPALEEALRRIAGVTRVDLEITRTTEHKET
ncbi:CBS domain-containing protein [Catenulispora subtropica]|uniref:CBS domain-containing protein n=1 Tax=Catenulispora subtropica TaxID=450798 RepID=A0ABP5DVW3_9ACTN